jgi:hypothetical protein
MGTLGESQVSGILARAMAQVRSNGSDGSNKRKQSTQDILQQALLDYIRDINIDIAALARIFEAEFGDAWREEIALRVFDEDKIPRQRPDESVKDYRARLEKELAEKMINPTVRSKRNIKTTPNSENTLSGHRKSITAILRNVLLTTLKNHQLRINKYRHLSSSLRTLKTLSKLPMLPDHLMVTSMKSKRY